MSYLYNPATTIVSDVYDLSNFVRAHPFATLISTGASGVAVSHLPLYLNGLDNRSALKLTGHVARANDHWKEIENGRDTFETLAIFHGP